MRLISIGFGKVKAVQCYVYLLVWLILVSIGLYWFLNRKGTSGLSALSQSGFGYGDNLNYNDGSAEGEDRLENTNRFYSNKNTIVKDVKIFSQPVSDVKSSHLKTFELSHESIVQEGDKYTESQHNDDYAEDGVYEIDDGPNAAVTRICNPVESIKAEDENVQVPDYKLEAVIILFRHGDRGPLTHIGHRNISHINCGVKSRDLDHLIKFATETLVKLPGYSQFVGPFNSFPKAPTSHHCSLGQLSQLGSTQLLTLGKMIRSTYKPTLVNLTTLSGSGTSTNSGTNNHPLRVTAYSTRYRRTFQSLIAFLFGLLGPKHLIQSTTIRESQSITFCFNECSCRGADRLKKAAAKKYKPSQEHKSAMTTLVNQINSVLGTDKSKKTGNSLLDSLLVYPCHKMELPCHEDNHKDRGVKMLYKAIKKLSTYPGSRPDLSCVSQDSLANLIKLIKTESFNTKKIAENRNYHLLSSYGLLKEIVSITLKMTSSSSSSESPRKPQQQAPQSKTQQSPQSPSHAAASSLSSMMSANGNYFTKGVDSKTKLVIFSGHDTTLQSLTAALGIFSGHPDIELPPFASRLIFEIYRKTNEPPTSPRKHYFRVIYNGISVTHLVSFCKDSNINKQASTTNNHTNKTAKQSNSKKNKYYYKTHFCPIENLVRFIHDHYFDSFGNATNFKDACQF